MRLALTAAVLLLAAVLAHAQLAASAPSTFLAVAVLPNARSVQVGQPAVAFLTAINIGSATAHQCAVLPPVNPTLIPFFYQTTDPSTNTPTGTANTPIDNPAGGTQTFLFALTPATPLEWQFAIQAQCADADPLSRGATTFWLRADNDPPPDVIAVAATPVVGPNPGYFLVAVTNIGAAASLSMRPIARGRVLAKSAFPVQI